MSHVTCFLPGSLSSGLHPGTQARNSQCVSILLSAKSKRKALTSLQNLHVTAPALTATRQLVAVQVNTKPGARRGKKAGKKKKDEAAEAEDLADDEQTQHEQEIEDAAGGLDSSLCICSVQNIHLEHELLHRMCFSCPSHVPLIVCGLP